MVSQFWRFCAKLILNFNQILQNCLLRIKIAAGHVSEELKLLISRFWVVIADGILQWMASNYGSGGCRKHERVHSSHLGVIEADLPIRIKRELCM